jgi:transcription elongation factor Elf1
MKNFEKLTELKSQYSFSCAVCAHSQYFNPSIFMRLGMNTGFGSCSKCEANLHLEIDESTGFGLSQSWSEYIEYLQANVTQVSDSISKFQSEKNVLTKPTL